MLKLSRQSLTFFQGNDIIEDGSNQYGIFCQVKGELKGVNNRNLAVITVWLKRKNDNQIQFITLKPNKKKKQP